jgi:phosphate/sulfate permease
MVAAVALVGGLATAGNGAGTSVVVVAGRVVVEATGSGMPTSDVVVASGSTVAVGWGAVGWSVVGAVVIATVVTAVGAAVALRVVARRVVGRFFEATRFLVVVRLDFFDFEDLPDVFADRVVGRFGEAAA